MSKYYFIKRRGKIYPAYEENDRMYWIQENNNQHRYTTKMLLAAGCELITKEYQNTFDAVSNNG